MAAAPVIADVLAALKTCGGLRLARMSGSGATCFALLDTDRRMAEAAAALRAARNGRRAEEKRIREGWEGPLTGSMATKSINTILSAKWGELGGGRGCDRSSESG